MTLTAPRNAREHDREYYWDFVTFSVEERLFRVPKFRFIEDSEIFATKYALDRDSISVSENEYSSIDEIVLDIVEIDGVAGDDFRNFLKALYPRHAMLIVEVQRIADILRYRMLQGELILSKDEWLSVLKLSSKWYFNGFRQMAIKNLTPLDMDPIDRVNLGKEYAIEDWLMRGYRELVTREAVITIEDAERMHWKTAINLYVVRDAGLKAVKQDKGSVDKAIRSMFAAEFDAISDAKDQYFTAEEREQVAQKLARVEQEAREKAEQEAEARRLEVIAAEEERRMKALTLELEKHRQKYESMKSPSEPKKEEKVGEGDTKEDSKPKEQQRRAEPEEKEKEGAIQFPTKSKKESVKIGWGDAKKDHTPPKESLVQQAHAEPEEKGKEVRQEWPQTPSLLDAVLQEKAESSKKRRPKKGKEIDELTVKTDSSSDVPAPVHKWPPPVPAPPSKSSLWEPEGKKLQSLWQ